MLVQSVFELSFPVFNPFLLLLNELILQLWLFFHGSNLLQKKVDVKYIRRIQYKDYLINACNDCSWILYFSNSFSLCWLAVSSTLQTNKISLKFFGGHHESFSLLLHISWNKTTTHQIKIYQNVIVWSRSKNVLKQLRFSWTWRIKIFF